MNPTRILLCISSCKTGGVPVVLFNLIRAMDKKRFSVALAAPDDGLFFKKFNELVDVHKLNIRGFYPRTLFTLRQLIKKGHFDIVHAHGRGAGLYGRLAGLGLKVKIVYSYHGFDYQHYSSMLRRLYLSIEKILLKWTDKVVCVSKGEMREAISAGVLIEGKAIVIPNGIDIEKFDFLKKNKTEYVVGTLSKICDQKGLEYLIPALAVVKNKYPLLTCFIAGGMLEGDDERKKRINEMVFALGMEKSIIFLGELPDTAAFFEKIDLYVSSSLWEGLPTAILEAFAAKIPVVATDCTGNNDVVVHRETGVLVAPRDPHALTEGIIYAFENRPQMVAWSENAYETVRRDYSSVLMADRYSALYELLKT
jgi:glycosyltransferase involved in cell wall biosynthesis